MSGYREYFQREIEPRAVHIANTLKRAHVGLCDTSELASVAIAGHVEAFGSSTNTDAALSWTVMKRRVIDHLRAYARMGASSEPILSESAVTTDPANSLVENLSSPVSRDAEERIDCERALSTPTLKTGERSALVEYYLHGRTLKEISDDEGISHVAVHYRLKNAEKKVRSHFAS